LDADESASGVTGLDPVRDKHETFIDVEPITGKVLNAAKRLQVNIEVGTGNFFTPGIPPTDLLPIVWVEEGGAATEEDVEPIEEIYAGQQIQELAPISGTAIGVVLLLTSAFIAIRSRKP
jgi:lysosome membrane protein 2